MKDATYATYPGTPPQLLAPPPDFRHVGLALGQPRVPTAWMGLLGAGALVGATVRGGVGAAMGVGAAAAAGLVRLALVSARARAHRPASRERGGMAIVPWGVVIDLRDRRVLRWAGVKRVSVEAVHGRDQGSSFTRYTVVTIDAGRERFVGRAPGTLPLERLTVHLPDYASESAHRIALDLDGRRSGEGPSEPDAELVLAAARAYASSSEAAQRLDLSAGRYRQGGARSAGPRTEEELRGVLVDRTSHEIDPRPFAAVLAAELSAHGVADDLVELVQSPLPLLAAFAKVAATKLGVARARVGTLEEVEPFLLRRDAEALAAWLAA